MEERRIWTSTELCGYLDFPYVAQVFVIQRIIVRLTTEERCCETVYGVTFAIVVPGDLVDHHPEEWEPVPWGGSACWA